MKYYGGPFYPANLCSKIPQLKMALFNEILFVVSGALNSVGKNGVILRKVGFSMQDGKMVNLSKTNPAL